MNLVLCISMTYVISCLEFAKNASYGASKFCLQIARIFLQYTYERLCDMETTKYLNPSILLPYLRDLTHSMTRPLVNISKIFSNMVHLQVSNFVITTQRCSGGQISEIPR